MIRRISLLVFILISIINLPVKADPLVAVLFDDAPALSTENLGTLGGTQNLPGVNGIKDATPGNLPPVAFDSGSIWLQGGFSPTSFATFSLPSMTAMSAAFWIDSVNSATFGNIWGSNMTAGGDEIGAFTNGTVLNILGPNGTRFITADVLPAAGGWKHIAYTYDSVGSDFHLYVDGVEVAFSGSWSGTIAASLDGLSIANTQISGAYGGKLDNLFIYDRVLTENEVQSLMTTNTIPEPASMILVLAGSAAVLLGRKTK